MKILTVLWLLLMLTLSHIPGEPSGEESKWLSRMTGVDESQLRRAAHIVVYLVLTVLVNIAFPAVQLWIRVLVLAGMNDLLIARVLSVKQQGKGPIKRGLLEEYEQDWTANMGHSVLGGIVNTRWQEDSEDDNEGGGE